jgi:hypothetical protein
VSDEISLITRFHAARELARANSKPSVHGRAKYHPPPRTLREYLERNLRHEFELRYYVLDHACFDAAMTPEADYVPLQLTTERGRSGKDIIESLLKVDFLSAQRHLSDSAGGRLGRRPFHTRCGNGSTDNCCPWSVSAGKCPHCAGSDSLDHPNTRRAAAVAVFDDFNPRGMSNDAAWIERCKLSRNSTNEVPGASPACEKNRT